MSGILVSKDIKCPDCLNHNPRTRRMKPKAFWTPDQFLASGECPYGRSVLYRLLNEGKIPAIRHSRSFVIPKAAWHRHLETCGGMLAAQ